MASLGDGRCRDSRPQRDGSRCAAAATAASRRPTPLARPTRQAAKPGDPLINAAMNGKLDEVRAALGQGVDVNSKDEVRCRPPCRGATPRRRLAPLAAVRLHRAHGRC